MASCSKAFKLPNFTKIEIIGFCLTKSLHKSNFHTSHAHHAQTWSVEPLSDFRLDFNKLSRDICLKFLSSFLVVLEVSQVVDGLVLGCL